MEAETARLNRRHWEAHGSELAGFLDAPWSRREDRSHRELVERVSY
jgi:hypothetical protein